MWFKKAKQTPAPVDYRDMCSNLWVNGIACRTPCDFCKSEVKKLEIEGEMK